MGIRNLFLLIKAFAPSAMSIVNISELSGKIIGIDASIAVHQWCATLAGRRIVNSRGQFINHIQGAFFRTVALLSAGIIPVFIFDGPPPAAKLDTLAKRKRARGEDNHIPREVFVEVMYLLRLMKIPVIQASSEAEAQAAHLNHIGALAAVASEDGDTLVFGAKYLIRGLNTSARAVEVISLDKLLSALGLDQRQFVDLCILLGSDYSPSVVGIGPKKAFALIKKHKSIENIPGIEDAVGFNYVAARREFLSPAVDPPAPIAARYQLSAEDITVLREYLIGVHGLAANRVEGRLSKLSKIII
jgi:flap endonuclease-1